MPTARIAQFRRAPRSTEPAARRRGLVMWLVLTLTIVLSVLFFSFNLSVRQRNAQAHAAYFGEVAGGLAQGATNLAWSELRAGLENRDSLLRQELLEAMDGSLLGHQFDLRLDASIADLSTGLGDDLSVAVSATVVAAEPWASTGVASDGVDPLEHNLVVEVRAETKFRAMPRTLIERRELRLLVDTLPVLGRFTLFVKEPERARFGDPGYNRFSNDITGAVDFESTTPRENFHPLVLYNHGDSFPALHHDLAANGWVFLGGSDAVRLHLTSGADYRFGEYFHFYNFLTSDTSRQAAFLASDPPAFFRREHLVGTGRHRYFLKHVIYGFFTRDRGVPAADMNRGQLLTEALRPDPNQRSGVLHLYGSTLSPSPTRVFGNVLHSFPIFTGVTVDADGDGRRDGLVRLLPSLDASGYARLADTHPIPAAVRHIGRPGDSVPLDPTTLTWPAMFPDYPAYRRAMSTIVRSEPYNTGVDYLFSRGEFPPKRQALDRGRDYPNPGDDVTVRRRGEDGSAGVHFAGDLNDYEGEGLADRAVLVVRDQEEFDQLFVFPGPILRMSHPVRVTKGDLELPSELRVEAGGLLVVEGDIRFDGIRCDPGERLSLVSRTGNLVSPFDSASPERPVEADLVALNGRLRVTDPSHPVGIHGTLATARLHPEDFQAGGRLVYDPRADPAAADRRNQLRAHLSDRPLPGGS